MISVSNPAIITAATYSTKAALQAATVQSSINALYVVGYTTAGDLGGAHYVRVGSQPSHNGKIQSADGAWWELSETVVNPLMFGADGTGVADSSAAFQSAYDYNTTGANVYVPNTKTFKISSPVTLSHPGTIWSERVGSNSQYTISAGATSGDVFVVNTSFATIRGLSINRPGSGVTGNAIVLNNTVRHVTDLVSTNTSTTVTSATASFTSADIGKYITSAAAGITFGTTITAVTNSTTATISAAATVTGSGQTANIGYTYNDIVIEDIYAINHNAGILVGAAQKCSLRSNHCYTIYGIQLNNDLWGDSGDNEIIGGTYQSTDDAAGAGIYINSGGGLKIVGTKVLGGFNGIYMYWNGPSTSLGPFISGCSIEGPANKGIYVYCNSNDVGGVTIVGCEIGVAGTGIYFDNTAPHKCYDNVIVGNMIRTTGGNTGLNLGYANNTTVSGNTFTQGTLGTAIVLGTNCSNAVVDMGANDVATQYSDSGTNNSITLTNVSANLDRFFGSTRGAVLTRTASGWAKLNPGATANQALITNGTGADVSYSAINLTNAVAGQLPVANGGTGLSSGTSGGVLGYTATGTLASSGALTANAVIKGGGAGAVPTASGVSIDASNDITGVAALTTSGLHTLNGGQIKFPATQNASADANTLDDYEEGTWTPVFTFATPGDLSVAYTAQLGTYTKIGRVVYVTCNTFASTFTYTTASGNFTITGFPFNAAATTYGGTVEFTGVTAAGYTSALPVILTSGTAVISMSGSGLSTQTLTTTQIASGGAVRMRFTTFYFA